MGKGHIWIRDTYGLGTHMDKGHIWVRDTFG